MLKYLKHTNKKHFQDLAFILPNTTNSKHKTQNHIFAYMNFYKSIAHHYDDIFPLQPAQLEFMKNGFDNTSELSLLDIGCGTGSLSIALAPYFNEVVGLDPDEKMLELAIEKAGANHSNLSFHPYGMLDIQKQFAPQSFDAILCFGNTLVHLGSQEEIFEFLKQAKKILKPGGKLLIQIINYDRIFRGKIKGLSTIDNERIKFVRNYHYDEQCHSLDFETILTIKSGGEEIRNSIPLLPIQKSILEKMLYDIGFTNLQFYGNFKRDAYHPDSIPLIIETGNS